MNHERKLSILQERPWLTRIFSDGHLFVMPVDYIIEHIATFQRERLGPNADNWTLSKESGIEELLDSGIMPVQIYPIRVSIPRYSETLTVGDGITRLRVFSKRGIQIIRTKMYHG